MRLPPHLSRLLLILCLPLVCSCAAQQSATFQSQLSTELSSTGPEETKPHPEVWQAQENPELADPDEQLAEDLTPPESEATASQEIKDLEKLGAWEEISSPLANKIQSDFPLTINRQVEYYLDLFQNQQRSIFASWLTRSGRYLPMMQKQLAEAGLPKDLAYLSMIESGFKPNAYSTAKASGLWQFMAPTAARFGLQVNKYVDERRDPIRSTQAAIQYLNDLYSQFGNWYVAVAAYNAGEGRIAGGLQKFNCKNFWDLAEKDYLAMETKRYVPQLIAAIIIAKAPKDYGFAGIQYEPPLAYEIAKVPARTQLAAVAIAANTDIETLYNLNRQLSKEQVPPGAGLYELKMPVGTAHLVEENLPRVHAAVSTQFKDHVVGAKDTIDKVCRKYDIDKITLLKANNLRKAKLIAGSILRIPYQTTQYALLSAKDAQRLAKSAKTPEDVTLHTVKSGETISQIATRYGTSAQQVASWNNLKNQHQLKVGQKLTVYTDEASPVASSTKKLASEQVAKAPSTKGKDREIVASRVKTSAKPKEATSHYQVKSGDSLWTIAERFDLSPADLKKWNKLESNEISPGLKLIIKSKS